MKREIDMRNERYHYTNWHGMPAVCGLTIVEREGKALLIFTEFGDNPGVSVTNYIEHLATEVYTQRLAGLYRPEDVYVVEHYGPVSQGEPGTRYARDRYKRDEFDLVQLTWNGREFIHPNWTPLAQARKRYPAIALLLPELDQAD